DMGFINDVKRVLRLLLTERQTLLFSATMPKEIESLACSILKNTKEIKVDPVTSTVDAISQCVYFVDKGNKKLLLASLLKGGNVQSALVFTRTKHGANRVVTELAQVGIIALAIHGNKSQTARQDALSQFKSGKIKVLIATDIAARGIDIVELSHVFNYDLPNIPETYIHRIGRTGRAGLGGDAVSFCNYDELEYLGDIEKLIGKKIPEKQSEWPMTIMYKTEKSVPPMHSQRNFGAQRQSAPNRRSSAPQKTDDRTKSYKSGGDSKPRPRRTERPAKKRTHGAND
ncbi:MAG: helicase-related protein, partial [Oscillospiraceae bacterium]